MAKRAKYTKQDVIDEADEVREMTIEEVRALPGLFGRVATAHLTYGTLGVYGYRDGDRKVCIVLRP